MGSPQGASPSWAAPIWAGKTAFLPLDFLFNCLFPLTCWGGWEGEMQLGGPAASPAAWSCFSNEVTANPLPRPPPKLGKDEINRLQIYAPGQPRPAL